MESPEINPGFYGQLIYDKEVRIYNREKITSSINGVGKTGQLHAQESNWTTFSIPSTKLMLRWIKYFHVRPEAMELLGENIGTMLFDNAEHTAEYAVCS